MAFSAGEAFGVYRLDISDARKGAAELRSIFAQIKQDQLAINGSGGKGGNSGAAAAVDQQKAERAILARANAEARLAQVQNSGKNALAGLTQAEQIYQQALAKVDQTSIAAIRTQSQLAAVQNRIAGQAGGGLQVLPRTLESFGTQAIDQFKTGLLGIVGPAALVTAGFAALRGTVQSFGDSLKFKAELDQNTASITAQLKGVRDSGQAFSEARVFADKYKLTQQETTTAIQASVPLLRQSKASLTDVLTVLAQLQVLKPEQGIEGAAFALAELQGGQSKSLATRFNIPIEKANELKREIQGGGDAVQVLGNYLVKAGIGAEALETRTKGVAGALNDVKIAQEQLVIAQGNLAASKGGIAFVQEQAQVYRGLANILNGDVKAGLENTVNEFHANQVATEAYNQAISAGKSETEAAAIRQQAFNAALLQGATILGLYTPPVVQAARETGNFSRELGVSASALSKDAQEKLTSQIASAALAQEQANLERDSIRAANGMLGAGDQALILAKKYNIAAGEAQFLIQQQQAISNATALADQRKGEQTGTDLTAKQFDAFSKLRRQGEIEAKQEADRKAKDAEAKAKQVNSAQLSLDLARAKTSGQRVAILQKELAGTTDQAERLRILAQIENERNSGAKRHTSELGKQLNLEERIRDSKEKQLKATLDAQAAIIRDRQDRRKEDAELRQANRILSNGRSSQLFKDAAADRIALINVERQQRALAISEQLATSGGQVINGKVFQSRQGGGSVNTPVTAATPTSGLPVGSGANPVSVSGGGGTLVDVKVYLDSQEISAKVITDLRQANRQAQAAGAK